MLRFYFHALKKGRKRGCFVLCWIIFVIKINNPNAAKLASNTLDLSPTAPLTPFSFPWSFS